MFSSDHRIHPLLRTRQMPWPRWLLVAMWIVSGLLDVLLPLPRSGIAGWSSGLVSVGYVVDRTHKGDRSR